jgi:hypothetical protein
MNSEGEAGPVPVEAAQGRSFALQTGRPHTYRRNAKAQETRMNDLLEPEVITVEDTRTTDRIECISPNHRGPVDDSPKARREAARHDPDAPAAFLLICPCCDRQSPLCEKNIDAILEWSLTGTGFGTCVHSGKRIPIDSLVIIPLNQGS